MTDEANVFPGPAEDVTNNDGMSVEDAASSSFDDWDRGQNGIAEGERESLGQHLKSHADAVGVTVIGGLNSLIEPAVALHTGDMTAKRKVIGDLIDAHNIHPVPEAEAAPVAVEYGQPAHDGNGGQVVSEEAGLAHVQDFISANPVAADELIQDHMTHIVADMRAQGYQPDLGRALEIAIQHHPRYSDTARQAQEAQQVARARQASVQISGGGAMTPDTVSDDLDDIISEQLGR